MYSPAQSWVCSSTSPLTFVSSAFFTPMFKSTIPLSYLVLIPKKTKSQKAKTLSPRRGYLAGYVRWRTTHDARHARESGTGASMAVCLWSARVD
jgi:hypothetical protein